MNYRKYKIIRFIRFFFPPDGWKLSVIIILGILTGLFAFLFYVSKAHSYLSDNPETCVNCHIMAPQYANWQHSSHREVATCNDCHVPHNNIFNHYYFKAKDGMRHATIFTLRNEPQVIYIHEAGRDVVQQNCIRCHTEQIVDNRANNYSLDMYHYRQERQCLNCHREVPHGRVNSLSSVPNARIPLPQSPVPDWLNQLMGKEIK
ncbi:MAG: cytochrome c nitrite reductase small subunit [Bacteroidetes bacterium HGW-Bacteroidetes-21]|jgi:cytochrome c nitrite reductase small subunit|nr:MAG: cytochrome c nitrite reductase small subunit [Bacteroidetes bacterium HGW-Bacteroidetes-21]